MGMMKIIAVIGVVTLVACGPGPLPRVVDPERFDSDDSFPTHSVENPLPIDRAIISGDLNEVRALLQQGLNPNLRWSRRGDRLPIMEVMESPSYHYPIADRGEFLRLLLQHGADPNAKWCPFESRGDWGGGLPRCTSSTARTALHLAAFYGDREAVALLLDAGAAAIWSDWSGASALDYAADEVVFELISVTLFPELSTRDQKALAWVRDYDGGPYARTPWRATVVSRALSQVGGTILAPPPPFGAQRDEPWSENRAVPRLRTLLRIGADPNERVTDAGFDWPPLTLALRHGQLRAARILLQNKADVNLRWCAEATVRDYKEYGVKDPQCSSSNGITPLMYGAAQGRIDAVELLLEFNADRSLKDWAGRSALDYAKTDAIRKLLTTER